MYAYVAAKTGQHKEFYEHYDWEKDESVIPKPTEMSYWRKHPNLHGWMHQRWIDRGNSGDFNGDELELTAQDIDDLEQDILNGNLPSTSGFFFGSGADDYYKEQDLQFIRDARAYLFLGLRVFYNSSW